MPHAARFHTTSFTAPDGVVLRADVAAGATPDSPAVVLLHGGGQTRHSWGKAARTLAARGYGVVNLDPRGHGDSGWSPTAATASRCWRATCRRCCAACRHGSRWWAPRWAAARRWSTSAAGSSRRSSALVLVDVVPRMEMAGANKIREFMRAHPDGFATLEEAADAISAYYPHRPRPKDIGGLRKNLRERPDGRLRWHWDPHVIDGPHTVEPPTFSDALVTASRNVRIPTLLVRGLESDIVGDTGVAALRADIPQLEVLDIAGAGHMVAGDRNDVFNAGILAFLERRLPAA